jgi:predicted nucleic acid-binding protein
VILLDTTVLVYAVGHNHPLREPCRRLLQQHAVGRLECATTIDVIQEFAHVYARRRPRTEAVTLAHRYAEALPLAVTDPSDLQRGLDLYEAHEALRCSDAVLAAVSLNHGLDGVASAERAFGTVPGLHWISPGPDL